MTRSRQAALSGSLLVALAFGAHATTAAAAPPEVTAGHTVAASYAAGHLAVKAVGVNLETATISQLRQGLDKHRFSARQLLDAYRYRIFHLDHSGPSINSVARTLNPRADHEAFVADRKLRAHKGGGGPKRKRLLGIPVLVKDNIDVDGLATTVGSASLAHSFPARSAPLVKRLRADGAIILGKANLTEFAGLVGPPGTGSAHGQTLNPYAAWAGPCGSSAGSGAAAAAAFAAVTVGTETNGSILCPANANSVVGIKTTVGTVSRTSVAPISAEQDSPGPMAKSVSDAATALTVMAGHDDLDPATLQSPLTKHDFTSNLDRNALRGKRIGYVKTMDWQAPQVLKSLRDQGATLIPVDSTYSDHRSALQFGLLTYELGRDMNSYLGSLPTGAPMRTLSDVVAYMNAHPDQFDYSTAFISNAARMDTSPGSSDTASYQVALPELRPPSRAAIDNLIVRQDLDGLVSNDINAFSNTGAIAGYPSVSVPDGYDTSPDGTFNATKSVVFTGPAWSEPTLVGLAYAYEQARPSAWRPPSDFNAELKLP